MLILTPFLVSFLAALVFSLQDKGAAKPQPGAESFTWKGLIERAKEKGGAYLEFLERDSLSAGVYRIAKGGEDRQQPHELDEVYYVVQGRARFTAGEETWAAEPGSVLFVAAGIEHRFEDIEEDLEVLVFFSEKR